MNKWLFKIFIFIFVSTSSQAQTFTVRGERIELPYERSTSNAYVLDKEDFVGKATINEVLAQVPGLYLSQSGAYGGNTTYFLRGQGRGQVKVFIDGVEVVDPSDIDRSLQLQHFSLAGVEKIEVIKGGQGALYGSDTSGGVILITTDKSALSSFRGAIASHETWSGGFQTQAKQGDLKFMASGDLITTEGISAYNDARVVGMAEKDFYKRSALAVGISHQPLGLSFNIRSISAKQDIDSKFSGDIVNDDLSRYDHMLYSLAVEEKKIKDGEWVLKGNIAHTRVKRIIQSDRFNGETNQLHVQAKWLASPVSAAVFFADLSNDKVTAASEFSRKRQESLAIGATHYLSIGQLFADQSVRIDKAQAYATRGSGRLGIGYNIDTSLTFKAQVGTGFKAPTLYQRYSSFGGDDQLNPTESLSTQVSLLYLREKYSYEITLFNNENKNFIDYDLTTSTYKNIGETQSYGAEWASSHKIEKFTLKTSYTWLRARDKKTDKELARRPRWYGNIAGEYDVNDRLRFMASHQAVSKRDDSGKLPYYDVYKVGSSWQHNTSTLISLEVDNLFDCKYESVRTYGTLGRTYKLQASWSL